MLTMASRFVVLLVLSIVLTALVVACGGDSAPMAETTSTATASPAPEPTSTPTAEPTPEPTSTPTAEPTPEPTGTPTAQVETLSLDEYLAACSLLAEGPETEDDATYGEISAAVEGLIEMMSSLAPPSEVADWHDKVLEFMTTYKDLVDSQPEDEVMGIEFLAIASGLESLVESVTEVENAMPAEIRRRMVEAGCIEGSGTGPESAVDDTRSFPEVTVGEDVHGALDYDGDTDIYRFTAEEGKFYQIDVALGTLGDPYLELRDSSDWTLASNDDYGGTYASRIVWPAPASGDYYLVVGGYGAGSYTLTVASSDLVDDHGNDAGGASGVMIGADGEGTLEYEGDVDVFRFAAEEGRLYQLDVALGTLGDSYLEVRDSSDWALEYNDDHGGTFASRIVWLAPASGDYYLAVGGLGAGSYTLTVAYSDVVDDHGNDLGGATPVTVGSDIEGALEYEGDVDVFRFTAEEGRLYQLDVALGTLDDSRLELLDSDEWFLASNDDYGDTYASRIVWPAPESGDYYLAVGGFGEGSYTLTVAYSDVVDDHGNDGAGATRVTIGADVEGTLEYEGDVDVFRFTAEVGNLYQVDLVLGTLGDSYLQLRDSNDWTLASRDDYGDTYESRIVWPAPASGDYYLVVGGFGGGSYTLTVAYSDVVDDHGNDADGATGVMVGSDAEGTLEYEDDVDVFRFRAEEGRLYQIDVALGTLGDSYLELWDSSDWTLASNDDHEDTLGSRIVWPAPASGDYYVAVGGFGAGSYTLTVAYSSIVDDHGNDAAGATGVTVGSEVEGDLEYDGDVDVFRFTAEEGQFYQLDVALGTLVDSRLELLDSDEWRLEYNDDHGGTLASRIFWEAPVSGDYYVAVGGFGAGSYTFTVARR